MTDKKVAAFGIYPTLTQAEQGVDALVRDRFSNDDISVLAPDRQGTKDFAHEKHTKAPEGATTGVAAGGALGGTLGLLAGVGALAIPGLGPFIAAGPIMGALAGLGVGGAVGGLGRSARRHGHSRVRSQALRRSREGRRRAALGSLRDV